MSLNTILATAPLTTTNYVIKATGTTLGNSLIYDNGTSIGINIITPTGQSSNNTALQIVGAGTGTRAQVKLTNSISGNTGTDGLMLSFDDQLDGYLYNFENGNLFFGTNNSVKLTIANTGAATFSSTIKSSDTNGFAIGSIASFRRIQYGSDAATAFSLLTDTNSYAGLYAGAATFSGSVTANGIIQAALPSGLPATFELYDSGGGTNLKYWRIESRSTDASYKYFNISSFNDALNSLAYGMRIRVPAGSITPDQVLFPNGNVGIGTSTYNYSSSGRGYLAIGGSGDSLLEFQNSGTNTSGYILGTSSVLRIQTSGSKNLSLEPNSGNVLIATETDSGHKLQVSGTALVYDELRMRSSAYGASYNTSLRTNTSASGILQLGNNGDNYILAGNTAAGGYLIFRVNCASESITAGTEAMRINTAGFIKASNSGTYLNGAGSYYETNSDLNAIVQIWSVTNASYADDVHQIRVTRAATSAYYFASYYSGVTGDKEFGLRGDGIGYSDGGWTTPASDYAEYFESLDGTALPIGSTVALSGNKIKIAKQGDVVIGVIRPKDAQLFLGNNASEKWNQKYLKNDYGSYIRDEDGNKILNPNYDSEVEYVAREKRDEWNIVGLVGQIPITKGQITNPNWVKMRDISNSVEEWLVK